MSLNDKDIKEIGEIFYKYSGNLIKEDMHDQLKRHSERRIKTLHCSNKEYIYMLKSTANKEIEELSSLVVNHETLFFRDFKQLSIFAETCLPELKERKRKTKGTLIRAWSVACSTGEEAYTLSIIFNAMEMEEDNYQYKIIGTDIDPKAIEHAKRGVYANRVENTVPLDYLEEYFTKTAKGYEAKPTIKNNISFQKLNLINNRAMKDMPKFDFIFCKNLLFYFDNDGQFKILRHLYDNLNLGGYLFLDYSVGEQEIVSGFKLMKNYIYYYKKGDKF